MTEYWRTERQAAMDLNVSFDTVRKMCKRGQLRGSKVEYYINIQKPLLDVKDDDEQEDARP